MENTAFIADMVNTGDFNAVSPYATTNLDLNLHPIQHNKSLVSRFEQNIEAIKVLKQIEAAGRKPTQAEQITLSNYSGFGGLTAAFPNIDGVYTNDAWKVRGELLKSLVTDAEYNSITFTLGSAFFTPSHIVNAMWKMAEKAGFRGGVVLEPSCGSGFIMGHAPKDHFIKTVAVELDIITAKVAELVYPENTVMQTGFENIPFQQGMFDLAIGNPPYSGEYSAHFKHNQSFNGFSIHNQFMIASIDALATNAIGVMIVSRYFMDAENCSARYEVSERAKLICAVRLPSSAFSDSANTDVVTDILVFRKYSQNDIDEGKKRIGDWVDSITKDAHGVTRNTYFESKNAIIGEYEHISSAFGMTLNVKHEGNLEADLAAFVDQLPEQITTNYVNPKQVAIRYEDLVSHLLIEMSGLEIGAVQRDENGTLYRIIEKNAVHGFSYFKQEITENTVWSKRFRYDENKDIYELVPRMENGRKVYVMENEQPTNRLVYDRQYIDIDAIAAGSKLGPVKLDKLNRLIDLRDTLKVQLDYELSDHDDIEANRAVLCRMYDAFVKKYSFINSPANVALLNELPDCALMLSLEESYTKASKVVDGLTASGRKRFKTTRKESAKKAAILSQRVVYKTVIATHADTIEDGLALSMSHRAKFDLEYVAQLCDCTTEEVIEQLHHNAVVPLIYFDHAQNEWVERNSYLSGNVRQKLSVAEKHGLDRNVEALSEVLPEQVQIEDISLSLGMQWIPLSVYVRFVRDISEDANARVTYEYVSNMFEVTCVASQAKTLIFANEHLSLDKLLNKLMNSESIRIYKESINWRGEVVRVLDHEATEQTNIIAEQMKLEFANWIYDQQDLVDQLTELYNEKFNSFVVQKYDGSHLQFVGKVPDDVIELRRHQKNAAWRGIVEPFVLYDHVVGSGKSYLSITRALERKRLGLSEKPVIVVPNHLVFQFAADVYRLYPSAKVLAATNKDFEKSRRKRLFAKIATGNYDLIIVPHSSFEFIKLSPAFEQKMLTEELDKVRSELECADTTSQHGKRTLRKLRDMQRRLETKLSKKMNTKRRDNDLTFEQLGITDLSIDEAHLFKNLFYNTNLKNIVGMGNPTGSNRAFDMYCKFLYLHQIGGSGVLMTGTPISNSACEMHIMMRFLIPNLLAELNLDRFDNWAKLYSDNTSKWESTESGKLKQVTRFARNWKNMRSLMQLWYQCADPITNDVMVAAYEEENPGKRFPLPDVEGGVRQCIAVDPTEEQQQLLNEVLAGFENLDKITDYLERNAERLRLMDRARKLSLAARCVDYYRFRNETGGKLQAVADNVAEIYRKWDADKGTQIIFLDRSVPFTKGDDRVLREYDALRAKMDAAIEEDDEDLINTLEDRLSAFNADEMEAIRVAITASWSGYQEIKNLLVAQGLPENEIRFIQEAKNDKQKQEIFDLVRTGEVRVLIGSTPRMGAGTNVNNRLVHLHHVDITYKPSDIEQREGRIIRQGNELYALYGHDNFKVGITAYITRFSIDAKLWDLCSSKLKMINAIRKYDGSHQMDFGNDLDNISMMEIAALATGNPMMLERVELEGDIQTLERMKLMFGRKKAGAINQIAKAKLTLEHTPAKLANIQASHEVVKATHLAHVADLESRIVVVDGVEYSSLADIQTYVTALPKGKVTIDLNGKTYNSRAKVTAEAERILGNGKFFKVEFNGKSYEFVVDFAEAVLNGNSPWLVHGGEAHIGSMLGHELHVVDYGKGKIGFAVLDLEQTSELAEVEIEAVIHKSKRYYTSGSITSAITKLFNYLVNRLGGEVDKFERELVNAKSILANLTSRINDTFPQELELEAKRNRLICISKLMSDDNADVVDHGSWEAELQILKDALPPEAVAVEVVEVGSIVAATDEIDPEFKVERAETLVEKVRPKTRGKRATRSVPETNQLCLF